MEQHDVLRQQASSSQGKDCLLQCHSPGWWRCSHAPCSCPSCPTSRSRLDLVWYVKHRSRIMAYLTSSVPKPRPGVFRITKNVHNILQGVSHPDQRISREEKAAITGWVEDNARRYWLSEGGPLRPPEEGGADVVIVSSLTSL